jgi:hypothetical protein
MMAEGSLLELNSSSLFWYIYLLQTRSVTLSKYLPYLYLRYYLASNSLREEEGYTELLQDYIYLWLTIFYNKLSLSF